MPDLARNFSWAVFTVAESLGGYLNVSWSHLTGYRSQWLLVRGSSNLAPLAWSNGTAIFNFCLVLWHTVVTSAEIAALPSHVSDFSRKPARFQPLLWDA